MADQNARWIVWMNELSGRFAEYGQASFLAWHSCDGQLLDSGSHPVVGLTNTF
jgi:hypothetical protein